MEYLVIAWIAKWKGGEKLKEEKLEQLRKVFKKILDSYEVIGSWNVKEIVNELVYEVKIRGTDRKE